MNRALPGIRDKQVIGCNARKGTHSKRSMIPVDEASTKKNQQLSTRFGETRFGLAEKPVRAYCVTAWARTLAKA